MITSYSDQDPIAFELWHAEVPEGEDEDLDDTSQRWKFIGLYFSRQNATIVVGALSRQPGFVDRPNGFIITKRYLNVTAWEGGFFTIDDWWREMEEQDRLGGK